MAGSNELMPWLDMWPVLHCVTAVLEICQPDCLCDSRQLNAYLHLHAILSNPEVVLQPRDVPARPNNMLQTCPAGYAMCQQDSAKIGNHLNIHGATPMLF